MPMKVRTRSIAAAAAPPGAPAPSAPPTAAYSAMTASMSAAEGSDAQSWAALRPVTVPSAASGPRNVSLVQRVPRMLGESSASQPAARNASSSADSRSPLPVLRPKTTRRGPPSCAIVPGEPTWLSMYTAASSTRSAPKRSASRSPDPMPFCMVSTTLSGPSAGPMMRAASSKS